MIGELLNSFFVALGKALDFGTPLAMDAIAQKHFRAHQERMAEFTEIAGMVVDSDGYRRRMDDYLRRLCAQAGHSTGLVSGATITVPLECFNALVSAASEGIAAQSALNTAAAAMSMSRAK